MSITGQRPQTAFACAVRREREGLRSPSGWKKTALSIPRHAPRRCHCQAWSMGPGRRDTSLTRLTFALVGGPDGNAGRSAAAFPGGFPSKRGANEDGPAPMSGKWTKAR
ncbi:hypothetical protein GCM10023175_63610 [Pseudonocardia xishanensis]|uniref:Uncharacterized protein n=1 Tax=Pseudonocardia xishanensis TaxID=630995 RepID=A0ABP8S1I7_9PSEU